MRSPMGTRTRLTLVAGFVIFVAGSAGAAYLGTRDSGGSSSASSKAEVLYAAQEVPSGTAGASALAQGLVKTKSVTPSARTRDAFTDPSQLSGRVAASSIPEGTLITADLFPEPQTRIGTLVLPPGKRALALELKNIRGVAGFVGAGDRIDVYAVATGDSGGPRGVKLVLQGVEVLNVNGTGLPSTQGQPEAIALVYLLAVTPAEAEMLVYMTEFERLYFDLVAEDEAPVTTPGFPPDAGGEASASTPGFSLNPVPEQ